MIVTFTDFGPGGPYTGQLMAVLQHWAPGVPVVSLLDDAPRYGVAPSAHLLAALVQRLPHTAVVVGVVDPGVGGERHALQLKVDGRWYVGPDNGLFDVLVARAEQVQAWVVDWEPADLSRTFHGRDLFAPVAVKLAMGETVNSHGCEYPFRLPGTEPLAEVIYLDPYGNAWTGIPAADMDPATTVRVAGRELASAGTFSEVPEGEAFWYENSSGLLEIAVNQGSAANDLGLKPGDQITIP